MADFYNVLRKTIEALPVATGQARRSVFDRARSALSAQLEAINPPLAPSEVSRQRLELEDSIRVVEEDFIAGKIIINSERENAARVAQLAQEEANFRAQRSTRIVKEEAEELRRSAESANIGVDAPPSPAPTSRAAAQAQAMAQAQASQQRAPDHTLESAVGSARVLEDPPQRRGRRDQDLEFDEPARRGQRRRGAEPDLDREPAPVMDREPVARSQQRARDDYYDTPGMDDPYMDDDVLGDDDYYDREPEPRQRRRDMEPGLAAPRDRFDDRRGAPIGNSNDNYGNQPYADRGRGGYGMPPKKRRVWPWLLFLLILIGGLGAGGYYAFQNQEKIIDIFEDLLDYGSDDVNPLRPAIGGDSSGDGPRRVNGSGDSNPVQPTGDGPKNGGRLLNETGQMDPATQGANPSAVAIAGDVVGAGQLPHAAILYEEGQTSEESKAFRGGTSWKLQEQANGLPIIIGRVEVPARNLSIDLTFRKNEDASLSASHLVELSFTAPPNAVGGGIQDVPGLLLKASEDAQGELLTSVSVKVSDTLFWVALSSASEDVAKNLDLMGQRTWFDIPVRYQNGRRGIITLEKGREGTQVFGAALESWAREG